MEPLERQSLPFLTRKMLAFEHGALLRLRITTQSDAAVSLIIRGMTREGPFSFRHIPTNDSVITTETFRIPDFPIYLSVTDVDGVLAQGQTFCTIRLELDSTPLFELCSGWVYNQKSLTYPVSNQADFRPGGGFIGDEVSSDPAAGSEISITVPTGEIWIIKSLRVTLVTDANAANRRVHIVFSSASGALWENSSDDDHAANLTRVYSFYPHTNATLTSQDNDIFIPIPKDFPLKATDTITTATVAIQAGDNFGVMRARIERYFTPA